LAERFGERSVTWLSSPTPRPLAARAAAAAFTYLGEVQGSATRQVRPPAALERRSHLGLDPATRRALEVFEPAPGGDPAHTLWAVLDSTVTPAGARHLRAWL